MPAPSHPASAANPHATPADQARWAAQAAEQRALWTAKDEARAQADAQASAAWRAATKRPQAPHDPFASVTGWHGD